MKITLFIFAIIFSFHTTHAQWMKYDVGTDASFRGLDVESRKVIWASGTGGTVIRSIDGGRNWKVITVPGAEELDFRDIEAFGKNTAYVLSIGNGNSSRIYKTEDGGDTWKLQFTNTLENAFFDSIAFWNKNHGIAQSDPIDGKYVFYETVDGETWTPMPPENMPPAEEGEAAFAASGTCIVTRGKYEVFLITGGRAAHVYHSNNRGRSWTGVEAPVISGDAGTGIFGIAFKGKRAMIVGGDYTKPDEENGTVAYSEDRGMTWQTKYKVSPFGYRSGVAFVTKTTAVVVGISGSDITRDGGTTWQRLDPVERNTVMAKGKKAVWAVGPKGEVSRLEIR
ncbi:MAG: glycosyl hydrolase [Acidobacteriota bacterium]|nr:glycosyl hydrolase [Acidobacteriota bacterium]